MATNIWIGAIEQGLLYGVMVLGVYITFRVLDFPDLTVDGSFTTGAAVAASILVQGFNPWLATFMGLVVGLIAGIFTGLLHTRVRIAPLLSGILMMIALYSVNLRIMGSKSMLSLLRIDKIFTEVTLLGIPKTMAVIILGMLFVILICYLVYVFLQTEVGLAL